MSSRSSSSAGGRWCWAWVPDVALEEKKDDMEDWGQWTEYGPKRERDHKENPELPAINPYFLDHGGKSHGGHNKGQSKTQGKGYEKGGHQKGGHQKDHWGQDPGQGNGEYQKGSGKMDDGKGKGDGKYPPPEHRRRLPVPLHKRVLRQEEESTWGTPEPAEYVG